MYRITFERGNTYDIEAISAKCAWVKFIKEHPEAQYWDILSIKRV